MTPFKLKQARFLDLLFLIGFALVGSSIAIGAYHSAYHRGQFPSVYDSYYEEGDQQFGEGNCGRAIEYYRVASLINREDANIFFRLAFCYQLTKQNEEAKAFLARAMQLRLESNEVARPYTPRKKKKKGS